LNKRDLVITACLCLSACGGKKVSGKTHLLAPPEEHSQPQNPGSVAVPAQGQGSGLPGALEHLVASGHMKVEKTFQATSGMTGYLVAQEDGSYGVLYGLDGYVIAGAVIAPTGENLTTTYLEQYAPKPDLDSLVKDIDGDPTVFATGPSDAAAQMYVFFDPNCIFCHKLREQLKPVAEKIRVHYVMLGLIKTSSGPKAAAIMSDRDPAGALDRNDAGYSEANEEGGIAPLPDPPPEMQAALKRHLDWLRKAGASGTPTIIYHDPAGKWTVRSGTPGQDWLVAYALNGRG
jgi:thiol:disulfide interchange protein DsbG